METKNRQPDTYETFDLGCAAFLLAKGFTIKEIESQEGSQRKIFHFPREALQDGVAYWNDEANINPKAMSKAIKELKDKLFEIRNQ